MDQVALLTEDSINGICHIPADLAHPKPIGRNIQKIDLVENKSRPTCSLDLGPGAV
jgi:hypothetical protein